MSTKNYDVALPRANTLQPHWGWLLGLGIFLLFLGCIGLGMEIVLTIVSMYFFSALLLISGLSHCADAFKYRQWKGTLWQVLIALLYLIGAGVVFYDPLLASTVITAFLAWVLIIIGVSRIAMGLSVRNTKSWGWILFAGLISLFLGILILLQWPVSGLWVIGMFIAIDMIVSGWAYILIAVSLHTAK